VPTSPLGLAGIVVIQEQLGLFGQEGPAVLAIAEFRSSCGADHLRGQPSSDVAPQAASHGRTRLIRGRLRLTEATGIVTFQEGPDTPTHGDSGPLWGCLRRKTKFIFQSIMSA
jgi:hypothetical protein